MKLTIEELLKLHNKMNNNDLMHDGNCAKAKAKRDELAECTCGLNNHIDRFLSFICDNNVIKLDEL